MSLLAYLDPNGSGGGLGALEVVIIILVWIAPSVLIARYAQRKGHSFVGFLLLGLLISWVVSGIAALLVSDRRVPPTDRLHRLEKLTELRDAGTLTDQEFEAEKARIMEERP
jgi:Short C-terminal domain